MSAAETTPIEGGRGPGRPRPLRVEHASELQGGGGWPEALLEAAQGIVLLLDAEARIVRFNAFLAELTGYSLDEVRGDDWFELFLPDEDHERLRRVFHETLREDASEATNDIFTRAGERRRIAWTNRVLRDSSGTPLGVLALGQDVTELQQAQRDLLEAEAEMRAVVDTAADGIITVDASGTIRSFNPAAERMFGYPAGEAIGHNVKLIMFGPHRDEHDDYIRRFLETGEKEVIGIGREVVGRRKDGSTFPVHLAVSEIGRGEQRAFAGILRDLSERHRLEQRLAEASTEERRTIAQDLHDSLGGQLTGVAILADVLRRRLAKCSSPEAERAAQLVDALKTAHDELRRISHGMMPVEPDPRGLMASLRRLAARTEEINGIPCEFLCETEVEIDDVSVATQLFHIAEEAVQNSVRHARARSLTISLERDRRHLHLTVSDDGIGIDAASGTGEGLGVETMKHRAGLVGGFLEIGLAHDGGTVVSCRVAVSDMP